MSFVFMLFVFFLVLVFCDLVLYTGGPAGNPMRGYAGSLETTANYPAGDAVQDGGMGYPVHASGTVGADPMTVKAAVSAALLRCRRHARQL